MKKASAMVNRIFGILFFALTVGIVVISFVALSDVLEHQTIIKSNNVHYSTYTEEDVHMLGDLMYAETKGCFEGVSEKDTKRAMKLVGQIVLNWQNAMNYNRHTELEDVIKSQAFSSWNAQNIDNIDTPQEVYKWAEELLKNGNYAPSNLMYVMTSQMEGHEEYAHIGNLYFYLD